MKYKTIQNKIKLSAIKKKQLLKQIYNLPSLLLILLSEVVHLTCDDARNSTETCCLIT